jgi:hypothetical protein
MRSLTLDATAGKKARRVGAHPEDPERISDPMDSRYGEFTRSSLAFTAYPRPIVDPTDPDCGESTL